MLIKLKDCPQILQDKISEENEWWESLNQSFEIVAVEKLTSTPFIDKEIIVITYRVCVWVTNTLSIYRHEECSHEKYHPIESVTSNHLIYGDILSFINNSKRFRDWLKYDLERAEKDSGG